MPKVSIILPIYNGEKYLNQTLDSILQQTFTDWELIVVDDCSNDSSPKIIEEYRNIDVRIKIIHNSVNKKLPHSLNIGFDFAKGDYLTWTSDDNKYEPDAIDIMVKYLDENRNIYMVRADMHIINDKSEYVGRSAVYNGQSMLINNFVGACFLYRKEVLQSVGQYNQDLFCVEDYDYWLRIIERYGEIGNIEKCLYQYRLHEYSLTATKIELIEEQLKKMRLMHLDFLACKLQNNTKGIIGLYCLLLKCGFERKDIPESIYQTIPILKGDSKLDIERPCVVYGAGEYGRRVYKLLKGNILFYIDKNESIVGEKVNGIPVKSLRQYAKNAKEYNLVIALSEEKIYEALTELNKNEIDFFITYNYLEQQLSGINKQKNMVYL